MLRQAYQNDGAMLVFIKDENGEVVEHAQVIKSGSVDTSSGSEVGTAAVRSTAARCQNHMNHFLE